MERLCDHMLEAKWYVPSQKGDNMKFMNMMMEISEAKFEEAFPDDLTPEGEIAEDYFAKVTKTFEELQAAARELKPYTGKNEVIMFKSVYNPVKNTYEIFDLTLRPCVWETGLVRQLTNYAVNGVRASGNAAVGVGFSLKRGPSYLVSLTMEDDPTVFTNRTGHVTGNFEYVVQRKNFEKWDALYKTLEDNPLTKAWPTETLKNDVSRFNQVKAKFAAMPASIQKWLVHTYERRKTRASRH
jgi:hypothetical protein